MSDATVIAFPRFDLPTTPGYYTEDGTIADGGSMYMLSPLGHWLHLGSINPVRAVDIPTGLRKLGPNQ